MKIMKRPPMKTPLKVSDLLGEMFKKSRLGRKLKQYSIFDAWEEIVGKTIAKQTAPKKMQGNSLIVAVSSHAWVQELQFMKPMIIKKILEHSPDSLISDIRFIVGKP